MTRYMKRKDSPHVFIYDARLKNNGEIITLPEGFDIKGYQAEMLRTKGKPEFGVEYFFKERAGKSIKRTSIPPLDEYPQISAIPMKRNVEDFEIKNTEIDTADTKDEDIDTVGTKDIFNE